MNRVLFEAAELYGQSIILKKGDARLKHLITVLDLKTGDSFKAGIIDTCLCTAVITEVSAQQLRAELCDYISAPPLAPLHIILGISRPIQLKRIFRSLGELGLTGINLIATELGEKSYRNSSLLKAKHIRTFLVDATAQAGQARLPQIAIYDSAHHFFNTNPTFSTDSALRSAKLLFDLVPTAQKVEAFSFEKDQPVWMAIGSERGWTENERQLFLQHNFKNATLGKRILRTETAVCAGVALMLAKMTTD